MILHADNGGYTKGLGDCTSGDPVQGVVCTSGEAGANNHPLRGGKYAPQTSTPSPLHTHTHTHSPCSDEDLSIFAAA